MKKTKRQTPTQIREAVKLALIVGYTELEMRGEESGQWREAEHVLAHQMQRAYAQMTYNKSIVSAVKRYRKA